MLAFTAGVFCLCGFVFEPRIPKGVTVDGIDVGGMAKSTAAEILRAGTIENLRTKQLTVNADGKVYEFSYPEINFKDNIFEILSNAERGRSYNSETKYYLCALNEVATSICQSESVPATEPYADFRTYGEPFIYYGGADGRIADKSKLTEDINNSLKGDRKSVV